MANCLDQYSERIKENEMKGREELQGFTFRRKIYFYNKKNKRKCVYYIVY